MPLFMGRSDEGVDDARQDHLGALALLHAVGAGRGGEAADLARVAIQRVAADVEAERLLLVREQLLRHPFVGASGYLSSPTTPGPVVAARARRTARAGWSGRSRARAAPRRRARCATSIAANRRARVTPFCAARPSNAPALTSASTTLRFTLRPSTRLQKSNSDRNGPPCSRATLTTSTAPSPTPLTAPRPKRITFLALAVLARPSHDREVRVRLVDVGAEDGDAVGLAPRR